MKTFSLRAERMAENAHTVASCLSGNPVISNVRYPGLMSDRGHEIASSQMTKGFGGMMAFDVGRTIGDAKKFIGNLKVIYHSVSLGATESLICIPYLTTMLYMPPERRTTFGVNENTVRFSIGIEPVHTIIDDLERGLELLK